MEIFKRIYDNPKNEDGTDKPNERLGNFELIETLFEDAYSGQWIGEKEGTIFLITEIEVSGRGNSNGGSRFEVKEITKLSLRDGVVKNFADKPSDEIQTEALGKHVVMESLPFHECKYCGAMTDQPDETCYKAPQKGNAP